MKLKKDVDVDVDVDYLNYFPVFVVLTLLNHFIQKVALKIIFLFLDFGYLALLFYLFIHLWNFMVIS